MNSYRRRIFSMIRSLLEPHGPLTRAIDFGSGDGWFASKIHKAGLATHVTPVEVLRRPGCLREPVVYDGTQLPFENQSFDLAFALDVLHHCPDPRHSLKDLLRCTRTFMVIKDHTYCNRLGLFTLGVLDEIGNRRFGIPCLHQYQHRWDWWPWFGENGFVLQRLIHPAPCHVGPMGWACNGLEFVALWRRM